MREDGDTKWVVMLRLEDCQRFAVIVDLAERHHINRAIL